MKRNGRRLLLILSTLCFCLMLHAQIALAESNLQLKNCVGTSATTLVVTAGFPESASGSYEVYRTTADPENGGSFQLIDTISAYGNTWHSQGDGYWYTTGDEGKIIFLSSTSDLSGEVFLYDSGLNLGQTYYYQLVQKSEWSGETEFSNIISGQTALNPPEILKSYAATNTSVKLSWQKSEDAQGYIIYRSNGKKWTRIKTIKKAATTTYTDKSAKAGKTYKYRIRAYKKVNGKNSYSDYSTACTVKLKNPTAKGTYSSGSVYGPSLGSKQLTDVRRVVQSFCDNYIKSSMSDYDKVWTAFCYIRANCDYAWRGWQYNNANTAWGALVYGEAQCSGYARGMKALCDAIGVKCYYVHANSRAANPSHQWNLVRVGGKWYVLDAQGGFFLVGSQTYQSMCGMTWDTKGLPSCSKKDHVRGGFVSSEM